MHIMKFLENAIRQYEQIIIIGDKTLQTLQTLHIFSVPIKGIIYNILYIMRKNHVKIMCKIVRFVRK